MSDLGGTHVSSGPENVWPLPPWITFAYSSAIAMIPTTIARRSPVLPRDCAVDGLDVMIDQYVNGSPVEGWPEWMLNQLDEAAYVLVVCTETYYRRFRGKEAGGKGKGATWEGAIIKQEIYDAYCQTLKFVPILFSPDQEPFIPEPLRSLQPLQPHDHERLSGSLRLPARTEGP